MSWEFLVTALIVCVSPGIGVVYTLSQTLGGGMRAGVLAAFGCTLATLVHMGVAMAGLAALLHTSAVLFQAVKYAGVAYLLWMAWAVLRETGGMTLRPAVKISAGRIVWRGILLNILNPKLPIFFVAFLPQFIPANAPEPLGLMAELGLAFGAVTFGTFLVYAAIAATGRRTVLGNEAAMTWVRRAFAASFAALGARLALERA